MNTPMDTLITDVKKTNKFTGFVKKITKNKFLSGGLILAVLLIGYFGFQKLNSGGSSTAYATTAVTKGTLIVTTAGSGQVDVSRQTEIKPKVSGKVFSVNVAKGDNVLAGTVIAQIDTKDAQKTIRDASLNLQNAQIALQKLKQPTDAYSIAQAELNLEQAQTDLNDLKNPSDSSALISAQNVVSQAQRAVAQAKDNLAKITLDTEQTLQKAYDSGYTAVSNAYLDLPQLVDDAYRVKYDDNAKYWDDNIGSYKLILGESSIFISNFLEQYDTAKKLFDASFLSYKLIQRSDDPAIAYKLINDTYETTKTIGNAVESARNLLDAMVNTDEYEKYYISEEVDLLRPIIMADLPVINKHISALQTAKDTIDTTNQNSPIDLKNAQDAIDSAEENLKERQVALIDLKVGGTAAEIKAAELKVEQMQITLDDLKAGADPLDIKSQELNVQQKLNSLNDAQNALADYSVTVPYNAIIADVNISQGEDVSSGTAIATAITNQMLATLPLNEVDVAKVKIGNKATLTFDAIDELSITGELVEIDTLGTVSQGVVTYNIKIVFDTQDERVKPGMSVSAAIITDVKQDTLIVPNSAIKTQGDISYVEVIDNAQKTASEGSADVMMTSAFVTPRQVIVEVGISNDSQTEILNNLKEGDTVVTRTITSGKTSATTSTISGQRGGSSAFNMLGGGH
jgi:multidrug efflux pump subunit AcrA (membrane-fusion protein)